MVLKNAIHNGTLITAPYQRLGEELVGLERDNNTGKIDHSPSGINCFVGDTKISLADGRELTFCELMDEYKQRKENYVYTINADKKKIEPKRIKSVWCSGTSKKIARVTLDNGEIMECTPEHLFMLCDGSYEEAQNLTTGVSLMSLRADGTIVQNVEIAEEAREVYDMEIEDNHNLRFRRACLCITQKTVRIAWRVRCFGAPTR